MIGITKVNSTDIYKEVDSLTGILCICRMLLLRPDYNKKPDIELLHNIETINEAKEKSSVSDSEIHMSFQISIMQHNLHQTIELTPKMSKKIKYKIKITKGILFSKTIIIMKYWLLLSYHSIIARYLLFYGYWICCLHHCTRLSLCM